MSARTGASAAGGGGLQILTGTYTGNGNATQAIAGVGFQPRFVAIFKMEPVELSIVDDWGKKADVDLLFAVYLESGSGGMYGTDQIVSLDVDGFTVGDGTPAGVNVFNVNGTDYTYVAFR